VPAYDFYLKPRQDRLAEQPGPRAQELDANGQQILFPDHVPDIRVIPFDSLTSPAERESIRARAAEVRPAPLKAEKVQLKRARSGKKRSTEQRRLELFGHEEVLAPPQSHIICDAPVAPASLRFEAAAIDTAIIAVPCVLTGVVFKFAAGELVVDKHTVLYLVMALATVPLLYKLLWTFAGQDSLGMRCAGLQLVDFDGNPPSRTRRYQRLFGSLLSFLAGGIGLVWSLVDEDRLTWHDHISSTFPTILSQD